MFCCTLVYVHSSIAIILMGKRELIAFLNLSCWCLVMVERPFLAVSRGCLQFVIVVFPDHTLTIFGVCKQHRRRPACIYAQSDQRLLICVYVSLIYKSVSWQISTF